MTADQAHADTGTPRRGRAKRDRTGGLHVAEWAAELAGTAFLFGAGFAVVAVLLSPLSPVSSLVAPVRFLLVGLTFGLLSALVAVSPPGRRSGAHLNPAVTIAFWLRGDVHRHDLAGYLAAQFAGALVGTSAFALALGPWARSIGHARTTPAPVGAATGVAIEAALTAALLVAVFVCLSSRRLMRATPAVVAIVLTGLIWVGSPPTGASLNPARSAAPALWEGDASHLWVYFAGPLAGALLAAGVAALTRRRLLTRCMLDDPRAGSAMSGRPGGDRPPTNDGAGPRTRTDAVPG
jgi:aquaporin Z